MPGGVALGPEPQYPPVMTRFPSRLAALGILLALAGRAAALEETTCRLEREGLPAAFGRCSTLVVPEDYANPDGPSLSLFVARIPASTATPAPDPLVLINGGPGGSTVDLYLQTRNAFAPALRDRDIILLDQRGTGRSLAGLGCAVPDDLELETASPEALKRAVKSCIDSFSSDPRYFTTSVAVRDLESLRLALGVEQWNIYGVSYGTRVAQHYLRRYPHSVRAVVLDGIVPAELVLGPAIADDAQAALDAIFARCKTDSECAERFAGIEEQFAELARRLAAAPVSVEIMNPSSGEPLAFELTEVQFQAVVRLMSYSATTAALLPLVIEEAYTGNYGPLAGQAQIVVESVAESLSFAMHNSVVCAEDVPYFPAAPAPATDAYLGTSIVDGLKAICELWPAGVLDEDFKTAVKSDRPVLVLSGENDPVTPPAYGEQAIAAGLDNAVHLVARGQGHGLAAVGCVPRLLRDFLAAPDPQTFAAERLEREAPMPFFLSFSGPAP